MAYLVCYSMDPPYDHTEHKAIYLDQLFYELIFGSCRSEAGPFNVLREIANLKYKSPWLIVSADRLTLLDQELEQLSRYE